jgi:hypothetical protein
MTPTKRRGSGITLDPDELRYATGAEPNKEPAPVAADPQAKAARPAARGKATAAEARQIEVPGALEGEQYPGEEKIKIGTSLPIHLKGQVDGAVRYAQDTGGVDGIESITDFIRVACSRLVIDLQNRHNEGQEFRVPNINRRGRTPSR